MVSLRSVVAIACAFVVAAGAQAWDDTGHMVVAEIAYRHLNDKAKAEVDRLSKIGGDDKTNEFITSAVWADDIRRSRRETGSWHFINLDFRTDGKPVTGKADPENVVWAIEKFKAVLQDRSASDADRAEALRFLTHFVGDIHQPLHDVSRESEEHPDGDRGGNSFRIKPPASLSAEGRPPRNLHALWDDGCGLFPGTDRPLTTDGRKFILDLTDRIEKANPAPTGQELRSSPQRWAEEGQVLAKNVVYKLEEGMEPSEEYLKRGRETCSHQVNLAGNRLANLLNSILGQ